MWQEDKRVIWGPEIPCHSISAINSTVAAFTHLIQTSEGLTLKRKRWRSCTLCLTMSSQKLNGTIHESTWRPACHILNTHQTLASIRDKETFLKTQGHLLMLRDLGQIFNTQCSLPFSLYLKHYLHGFAVFSNISSC